jgi:hypothetical protein
MRHRGVAFLLPGLLVVAACSGGHEPVARLVAVERQLDLPHGRMVPFQLRWEPARALPEGVRAVAFVHLLDAQGNVVRTFDHGLAGRWAVGERLVDRVPLYHSAIGPALPAGDYRLTVGLYDGGKKRFALRVEGEELRRQEYVVAQVHVPEVSASAPAFAFSSEWQAPEPGTDRQAVARRWLSGDGTLEARGLPADGRIWMLLRIPVVEPPLRMLLEPGVSQATARVTSDCGARFSADVTGGGFHELAVPVKTAEPCSVAFDTNYAVVEMGASRRLSLGLDQLGWEPGAASTSPPSPAR